LIRSATSRICTLAIRRLAWCPARHWQTSSVTRSAWAGLCRGSLPPAADLNIDFSVTTDAGETFGLSVFLRDRDEGFRTYFTSGRGVEELGTTWSSLDLTPLGRAGRLGGFA
jgi:predicted dithiol-disulfide oxidoreductase (DUF899 family)